MGDTDVETFSNITRADYDFDDEAFDCVYVAFMCESSKCCTSCYPYIYLQLTGGKRFYLSVARTSQGDATDRSAMPGIKMVVPTP